MRLAIVAALAISQPALAQDVAPLTRDTIDRGLHPAADPPAPAPHVDTSQATLPTPCQLAEPPYADLRIPLKSVHFAGAEPEDVELLAASWQAQKGQTIAAAAICDIRDEAAQRMNARGYITAVEVPPQQVSDGVITLNILFLRLKSITITGVSGRNAAKIRRILQPLLDQPRFNTHQAERALLLAQDLPGLSARMTLRPANAARGDVIGDVAVVYRPVTMDVGVINTGPADAGPWGISVNARLNGLFGLGDRTTFGLFTTAQPNEQQVARVEQEVQLTDNGLTLVGGYTAAWSGGGTASAFRLKTNTSITALELHAPLLRQQPRSISLATGFEIIRQEVRFGSRSFSLDDLKFAYARADYDASAPGWRSGASLTLRKGLGTVCSTASSASCTRPSRLDADPQALILRATGYAVFDLTPRISFSVAPRLQYSPSGVPTFELMTGGNYTIGRGFAPGSVAGDSGLGVAAEARFGALRQGPGQQVGAQPYVFVDGVRTWTHSTSLTAASSQALTSAGIGVRLNWNDRLRLDSAVSLPLHASDSVANRKAAQLLLSLSVSM